MKLITKWIEDIKCVFARDPAARNIFEVITCYPGVQVLIMHRLTHRLWQLKLYWLARFLASFSRWITGIEIHPGAKIGRRLFIDHGMGVVIGETSEIGDDCTLYQGVTLGGVSWDKGKRHPTLKDGVIIGAGAKILGPIFLGNNVKIGSNSVVIKSINDNQTVIGVPARLLKEQQQHLEKISKTASDIGFNAYGIGRGNMVDPTIQAVNAILDHLYKLDQQMHIISKKLNVTDYKNIKDIDISNLEIKEK